LELVQLLSSHAFLKILGRIAAADHVGGKEFPFKAASLEEDYTVKQMFKLVETGLFWKFTFNCSSVSIEKAVHC
jgi:hypothetical protein